MPDVCIGFEVHQPYRLNQYFSKEAGVKQKDLESLYLDSKNHEILSRVCEQCYRPASEMLLTLLDQGFRCALSLSGTLIEQLEKWEKDQVSLFQEIARHSNAELLAQTYYHSIAGLFADKSEFIRQVIMHRDMVHDIFGVTPVIVENTGLMFDNEIAAAAQQMGFSGIWAEGAAHVLEWRCPNHLYRCNGIPVFLRNTCLSDDIAFRFGNPAWDKYPLTADTYAAWLRESPGELITLFFNLESFGEHHKEETGIFDFMQHLPREMAARDVTALLPSRALKNHDPAGTIDVTGTISWADVEKDVSAWIGNERQYTAYSAIQKAETYAIHPSIWRYLQISDHFSSMASGFPNGKDGLSRQSNPGPEEVFRTYMQILADYEKRSIRLIKNQKSAKALRTVSPDEAFHFRCPTGYCGYTAYNLDQFYDLLQVVPNDSIMYHLQRGDFSAWIAEELQDLKLAEQIAAGSCRQDIITIVGERKEVLWNPLR
ncbi:MAG: glycoside hydrolase family 57 protein [Methanospirillaceae archaeon]|nr:glycoside hydrolase family 57 protein [Methanospirillaceae archaeon]